MQRTFFTMLTSFLLIIIFNHADAQNWSLSGNSLSGSEKLGATNSADLKIITNNNTRMTVKSTGKVGIGTTAPAAKLDIKYNSGAGDPTLSLTENESDFSRLSFLSTTNSNSWTIAGLTNATNSLSKLNFYNNIAGNIMSLSGDGKINIGGSPIDYTMTSVNNNINSYYTMGVEGGYLALSVHTRGVETLGYGDSSAVAGSFSADNPNSYDNVGLQVSAKNAANQSSFYPINTGMYCNGTGNLFTNYGGVNTGISCYGAGKGNYSYGIVAQAGDATTNYAVYGTYYTSSTGTKYAGYFNGNLGGTGIFSYTSDQKLKKDIKPETGMLDRIMKLQPSNYHFRTGEFGAMNLAEGLHHGLIAQQLSEVFPELVSEQVFPAQYDPKTHKITQEEVKYLGVNYTELIAVLISGMQEQQKQIDQLSKELEQTKSQVTSSTKKADVGDESFNGSYLFQNAPNPFSQQSEIKYVIPATVKSAAVVLRDLNGNIVKSFDHLPAGSGSVSITAGSLSSGTYSYSLIIDGNTIETKNFVITK